MWSANQIVWTLGPPLARHKESRIRSMDRTPYVRGTNTITRDFQFGYLPVCKATVRNESESLIGKPEVFGAKQMEGSLLGPQNNSWDTNKKWTRMNEAHAEKRIAALENSRNPQAQWNRKSLTFASMKANCFFNRSRVSVRANQDRLTRSGTGRTSQSLGRGES